MLVPPPFGFRRKYDPVPTDGPGNVFVPATADNFTALTMQVPQHLYLMQDTSPNDLADVFGTKNLSASTLPTYSNAVAGWTRLAVGTTQVVTQGFIEVAPADPNPSTTSVAWMAYAKFTAAPGGLSDVMGISGANGVKVQVLNAGTVRIVCKGVQVTGVVNHNDGNVHPILMVYNRTLSQLKVYTDLETITGTYASTTAIATLGYGSVVSVSAPMNYLWGFIASGAIAESYDAVTLTKLGW